MRKRDQDVRSVADLKFAIIIDIVMNAKIVEEELFVNMEREK